MKKVSIIIALILLSLIAYAASTKLQVFVQKADETPIEGAMVILYANEADYRASKNPVGDTLYTDAKGRAKFKDLQPKVYYLDVVKGDLSNTGQEAQTEPLTAGKNNRILVVLE